MPDTANAGVVSLVRACVRVCVCVFASNYTFRPSAYTDIRVEIDIPAVGGCKPIRFLYQQAIVAPPRGATTAFMMPWLAPVSQYSLFLDSTEKEKKRFQITKQMTKQ